MTMRIFCVFVSGPSASRHIWRCENLRLFGKWRSIWKVRSASSLRFNRLICDIEWNAIAHWHWSVNNEELCGICRAPFDGHCPDCRIPGDDCPLSKCSFTNIYWYYWIVVGECSHCFHMHCLFKWIQSPQSQQQCPMDRKPWVTSQWNDFCFLKYIIWYKCFMSQHTENAEPRSEQEFENGVNLIRNAYQGQVRTWGEFVLICAT
jgi:anaphase-promoting complex subunit 11